MESIILAKHALVGAGEDRRWLNNPVLRVRDGRIIEVSARNPSGQRGGDSDAPEAVAYPDAAEVIDLGPAVLFPGFIDLDALVDIDHLLLDSWHSPQDALLLAGSAEHWRNHRTAILTPSERVTLRTFGLVQLALHGITSYMPIASEIHLEWNEQADELREMARISKEIGLRGWLGPSYRSAVSAAELDADGQVTRTLVADEQLARQGLEEALKFADELIAADDPLLSPVLLPCRIETMSDDLLSATAETAAERDLLVRLHSLQQGWERILIQDRLGITPLDLLERHDLLNDRLLIPHALWTDRNPALGGLERQAKDSPDLRRIAEAGASVVHCPLTTFRYGGVLNTLSDYNAAGITMALGTDSFPPDLVRGMDVGLHAARVQFGHGSADYAQYVNAATTGGATALHRPDLGTIQEGATADFTAFSMADFRDGVIDDPLRTLVLNGTARNAVFTMVSGRTVMRDGRISGIDLTRLRSDAQAAFDKLREGYALRDPLGRAADTIFPSTFPQESQC
ncbi:amidohydrolase family protein [Micrococcaceae bacterium RIT802]|nr:amidohydrolase family protein [Micrococcaceae bacterium RIT 802]